MTDCWLITNAMSQQHRISYHNNSVIVVISGIVNRLNGRIVQSLAMTLCAYHQAMLMVLLILCYSLNVPATMESRMMIIVNSL